MNGIGEEVFLLAQSAYHHSGDTVTRGKESFKIKITIIMIQGSFRIKCDGPVF